MSEARSRGTKSSLAAVPWPAWALIVGWMIAALVLFGAGMWVSNTNRYDDCEYVSYMGAYFCPVTEPPKPAPRAQRGEA